MTRWLTAVRLGYGAGLMLLPAGALGRLARVPIDRRAVVVARVLGARELVQAEFTRRRPTREVLLAGAGVDALHAASMVALAAVAPRRRRLALGNAAQAALLAAGSLAAAGGSLVEQK